MATNQEIKDNVDEFIIDPSSPQSVTRANVGGIIKSTVDYTDQEVSAIKQNSLAPSASKVPTVNAVLAGLESAMEYTDEKVAEALVGVYQVAGNWDASGGTFPTTGTGTANAVEAGDVYIVSDAGTMGGVPYSIGDRFYSLVNSPGQTAGNWDRFNFNPEEATDESLGTVRYAADIDVTNGVGDGVITSEQLQHKIDNLPSPSIPALTKGTVIKASPAAALIYGFNTVTGGAGSVKLPEGTGISIGSEIYVLAGATTLVQSYDATNLIYFGRVTGPPLPMVKITQTHLWRFTYFGSNIWIAEKVLDGYREYRARLFQTGTAAPTQAVIFNDDFIIQGVSFPDALYRLLTYQYVDVGKYSMRINTASTVTLSATVLDVSFSDGKANITGISNGTDGTLNWLQVDFETRDPAGVLANGILQFTSIYFRYYGI